MEAPRTVQLVACSVCHTQYDVSDVSAKSIPCRCGQAIDTRPQPSIDAAIHRCGSCGAAVQADAPTCSYCSSEIVRDPDKLSLICPECFARTADDSRFCTACGVAFRPEPVRIDGHEFPCPVCTALMPPRQVGGVGLNECLSCHGLWVPGDGFDALVSRAIEARRQAGPAELQTLDPRVRGSNPAAQRIQYRKCPECDGFMQRRNYRKTSGVIVDRCNAHGTWLDADELEQIAGYLLTGGRPSTGPTESTAERRTEAAAAAVFARISAEHTNRSRSRGDGGDSLFEFLTDLFD